MTYNLRDPWENRLCCVGAAAAVAATVATVAAVGMQVATQAGAFGKKGGAGGGAATAAALAPGTKEQLFNRGTQDILDTERQVLDDALAQGKLLEPEMYEALGLRPVYDRPEDPELARISAALTEKQNAFNGAKARLAELQNAKGQLKGKRFAQQRKDLAREIRQIKRASGPAAQREIAALTRDVEQRGAVGRKVVGFEAIPGVADPTGSAGGAFGGALNQFNEHLAAALAGKEPIDPTLARTFDERERTLRERLRRQMGPDYETSTAGEAALANFDREKAEAFAAYNRAAIGDFSQLAEGRAGTLAQLTAARLQSLSYPAAFRTSLAQQLEGAAAARNQTSQIGQTERGLRAEAARGKAADAAAADAQAREQQAAQIGAVLQGVSGLASGLNTASGMGGSARAALLGEALPAGVQGPETAGLLGAGGRLSPSAGTLFGR